MENQAARARASRRTFFPLSYRIAIGYVFAAIVPLVLVLAFIWTQTRPALIQQANTRMTNDAQTRVQLIDNYIKERVSDGKTLVQVPSLQSFVAMTPVPDSLEYKSGIVHAVYTLQAGLEHDKAYTNWSLFDVRGNLRLAEPQDPAKHGKNYFTDEQLKLVTSGQTLISPVYYDRAKNEASIDIYEPIVTTTEPGKPAPILGFTRATLKLDYIWHTIVDQDNNGTGSYAFIVDENGVRIADSNAAQLFTDVAKVSDQTQQTILNENRYGEGPLSLVNTLPDPDIAHQLQNKSATSNFTASLAGQNDQFQVARQAVGTMPWQYFAVSPLNTVTDLANREIQNVFLLAGVAALIVAIGGAVAGKRITFPILHSVERLRTNSQALSTLAEGQQEAANEQVWVVDSSHVGLQSVQYYTDAARRATSELQTTALYFQQQGTQLTYHQAEQQINTIIHATKYLENALQLQDTSNQKLATALKVASQVTDQFNLGASSASEAAEQLEQVVQELRSVVGKQK